jgi:hypothetical protein
MEWARIRSGSRASEYDLAWQLPAPAAPSGPGQAGTDATHPEHFSRAPESRYNQRHGRGRTVGDVPEEQESAAEAATDVLRKTATERIHDTTNDPVSLFSYTHGMGHDSALHPPHLPTKTTTTFLLRRRTAHRALALSRLFL